MDVPVSKETKLVSVEYPGIVKNPQKMLDTLGGEVNITKTYNDPSRRLELRFRPNDVYAKPACGDRFTTDAVLLRVRRRKRRTPPDGQPETTTSVLDPKQPANHPDPTSEETSPVYEGKDGYDYKAEVMGTVNSVYKFNGMADFQYLPMAKKPDGSYTSLRDKLILTKLADRTWLEKEAPLFLPPPIFSRLDLPMDYAYRDGPKHGPNPVVDNRPPHIIGVARQRRPQYTLFAMFEDKKMPVKPYEEAVKKVKIKMKDMDKLTIVEKLFQERPIWSKNAIKYHTHLTSEQLKCILPTVAYYYVTGPWRTLWVRLGYDPRTDPLNKKYQLLDFRVRQKTAAEQLKINTKRSTYRYSLPNTVQKTSTSVAVIKADTFKVDWSSQGSQAAPDHAEATWKFRPGFVPPFRQMFYQFLDIEEPEIQRLVHENDGKEVTCTEADGWCLPGTQHKARSILYTHLKDFINRDTPPTEQRRPAAKRKAVVDKEKPEDESDLESSDSAEGEIAGDEEMVAGEDAGIEEGEVNEMETELLDHLATAPEDD